MIKKTLPIVLVAILFIAGCNITATEKAYRFIKNSEKTVETAEPKATASKELNKVDIMLRYPTQILSQGAKLVDFTISSFPQIAAICRINAIWGGLSVSELVLTNMNQFIYYFPNREEPLEGDSISLAFYDEYGRFISKKYFNIQYIEDVKEYRVMERLPN